MIITANGTQIYDAYSAKEFLVDAGIDMFDHQIDELMGYLGEFSSVNLNDYDSLYEENQDLEDKVEELDEEVSRFQQEAYKLENENRELKQLLEENGISFGE